MIEFVAASPVAQAAVVVVAVLLQAVGLYVGYGVLERIVAPSIIERIERA